MGHFGLSGTNRGQMEVGVIEGAFQMIRRIDYQTLAHRQAWFQGRKFPEVCRRKKNTDENRDRDNTQRYGAADCADVSQGRPPE